MTTTRRTLLEPRIFLGAMTCINQVRHWPANSSQFCICEGYAPKMVSHGENFKMEPGQTLIMECKFRDLSGWYKVQSDKREKYFITFEGLQNT